MITTFKSAKLTVKLYSIISACTRIFKEMSHLLQSIYSKRLDATMKILAFIYVLAEFLLAKSKSIDFKKYSNISTIVT